MYSGDALFNEMVATGKGGFVLEKEKEKKLGKVLLYAFFSPFGGRGEIRESLRKFDLNH